MDVYQQQFMGLLSMIWSDDRLAAAAATTRGKHCLPSLSTLPQSASSSVLMKKTHTSWCFMCVSVCVWWWLLLRWPHLRPLSLLVQHQPSAIINVSSHHQWYRYRVFVCVYGIDSICPLCPFSVRSFIPLFSSRIVVIVRMASNDCSFCIYFSISVSY